MAVQMSSEPQELSGLRLEFDEVCSSISSYLENSSRIDCLWAMSILLHMEFSLRCLLQRARQRSKLRMENLSIEEKARVVKFYEYLISDECAKDLAEEPHPDDT